MDLPSEAESFWDSAYFCNSGRGWGWAVPKPGLICQFRHLSWKHLAQRCKSFTHTDSVLTKSCAPLGVRNSPTRCGNTLYSLNFRSFRLRLQNKGRQGTGPAQQTFCIIKTSPPFQTLKFGPPRADPHSQPHHPTYLFILVCYVCQTNEDAF